MSLQFIDAGCAKITLKMGGKPVTCMLVAVGGFEFLFWNVMNAVSGTQSWRPCNVEIL